jgi:hypothetical protein
MSDVIEEASILKPVNSGTLCFYAGTLVHRRTHHWRGDRRRKAFGRRRNQWQS